MQQSDQNLIDLITRRLQHRPDAGLLNVMRYVNQAQAYANVQMQATMMIPAEEAEAEVEHFCEVFYTTLINGIGMYMAHSNPPWDILDLSEKRHWLNAMARLLFEIDNYNPPDPVPNGAADLPERIIT